VSAASAASSDACDHWTVTRQTTKGQIVWIPSNRSAGPFQWGGSQQITYADGKLTAKTHGRAHTVGGGAKIDFKLAEISGKYDYQWNRSTTTTNSFTQTFATDSGSVSRKVQWRWRLYVRGYKLVATKTMKIPTPCLNADTRTIKRIAVIPDTAALYTFNIERYSKRNLLLDGSGRPMRWF
ncbi:MAG TPA: hypothetical protein VD864_16255, partial [Nocardioides sp.]|nr:hypothetical protein [Nocardioides sp.]